jgi:hypothetical protein
MSVSTSPFLYSNYLPPADRVQATPLDAPVQESGDVQRGRDDADAVANDLGGNEESVHSESPSVLHIFGSGAQTGERSEPAIIKKSIPTSWYVVKRRLTQLSLDGLNLLIFIG